ncbi:dihydrofolate reductase [Clostridium sartagoforme]|uniref:Dihydrofolate reductase n=1 Tax=Clostridium sartagoforme TaxID=84031 RepID=A0A4V3RKT7_9CLOT|nr:MULTISPECIES: dihydrofolate reductase family protein [Clostridium]MBS5939937.1 dihydrofolate reductase family protein [Clostridium sp.]TGY41170.1 dihydrofolate reductase [Clostridium sartagoforme]
MSGKIILNLAISLDGYIADENGGYDWIVGDDNSKLNTENKSDFAKFLEGIDVVVMGRNCYNQNFHKDYKEKDVYIATSENIADYENYHFMNGDICKTISDLKNQGKNIFLFGGGVVIDSFVKEDIIDEYIIGIIPTILGKGRKLFLENNPKIDLNLQEYSVEDGIIVMKYSKRNKYEN